MNNLRPLRSSTGALHAFGAASIQPIHPVTDGIQVLGPGSLATLRHSPGDAAACRLAPTVIMAKSPLMVNTGGMRLALTDMTGRSAMQCLSSVRSSNLFPRHRWGASDL